MPPHQRRLMEIQFRLLNGILILLKDIMGTTDSMETTAGSICLVGSRPGKKATLVQKLRPAGALVLGKTNMSEWVAFRTVSGGSGWYACGGLTLGAY